MYRVFLFLVLFLPFLSFAQPTKKFTGEQETFYRAEDLFEKQQFGSARELFHEYIQKQANTNAPFYIKARYYEATSALELFNDDAIPLLEKFNSDYPENNYRFSVYFNIGKYYYQKKSYDKTILWFSRLSKFDVDTSDRAEYNFKLGHSYFKEDNFEKAKLAFSDVKDGNSPYANPAQYYFAHISYQQKHYKIALEGFEKLMTDKRFSKIVPYYIAQIYYLMGDYQKVTDIAKNIDSKDKPNNVGDIDQLVGDAYYRTQQYDEAAIYLEKYNKTHKTTRPEDYQLGYAYSRIGQYSKAIKQFDKVTTIEDSIAQIAYYNIAEAYLKSNDLSGARDAFDRASRVTFNEKITEDALYNFAILSYKIDVNPYNEAVVALQDYLEKYPKSDRSTEVYNCLITVYTQTHRFQDALKSLSDRKITDSRLQNAYQIVAFNLAVEYFQNGNYDDAISTFQLSRKYHVDELIVNKSFYWTGDAYYRKKEYDKAIEYFESFIKYPGNTSTGLRGNALYNLGYCYMKTKNYEKTLLSFQQFITSYPTDKEKVFDAYLRLGDLNYMLKNNNEAIKYYSEALRFNNPEKDYAYYYLALTYGLQQGGMEQKIEALNNLISQYPKSSYLLTAIYELGLSYRTVEKNELALQSFDRIIRDFPSSNMVTPAKLSRAGVYFDMREYGKSELAYTQLLDEQASNSEICIAAVEGLKTIYIIQKKLDKISTLSKYPCAKNIENQVEDTYYDQAISNYLVTDTNYAQTIESVKTYLEKFPNGKYAAELTSYMANSYVVMGDVGKGLESYEKILNYPNNGFTEEAASFVAKYYYNSGDYQKSLNAYRRLDEVAVKVSTIYQAKVGLMRSDYLLKNYGDAATVANQVIPNSLVTKDVLTEANFVSGVSNYFLKNYSQAVEPLQYAVKNAKNSFCNEAKFYLAQINFDEKNLDAADQDIRELLKIKPAYDYWIAKGLLLQTKISMARNDLFKAEQTLASVRENYQVQDDGILTEADALWSELMQLKNMPKNIKVEPQNSIEIDESKQK